MGLTVQQSCINKLLLVCFCLDVPVRETFAPLALLMRKRILRDNIIEIANLVNDRLIDYRRRYCRNPKRPYEAVEEEKTRVGGGAKPHSKNKTLCPTTIAQLEKKLDELLGRLRVKQPPSWKRLEASGLIERASGTAKKERG